MYGFRRPLLTFIVILTRCLAAPPVSAQEASLSETWIKDDPRLTRTVSIPGSRIYVPDLLAALSQTSGVKLTTGERDGSSEDRLVVFLHNNRLADVMNALWSQLSYKRAEYRWERIGLPGDFRYRFVRPRTAQELPEKLSSLPQFLFERQFHHLTEAAFLAPDARRDYLYKHVDEIYDGEKSFVELDMKLDRSWQGLQLLGKDSYDSRVLALLRGETPDLKLMYDHLQIPLTDAVFEMLHSNVQFRDTFDNAFKGSEAKYLKLRQETVPEGADYDREITFGYVYGNGSWKPVTGGRLRRTLPPK